MNEFLPVSIVTPAYNAADTIAETIESVLAQTMPQWELIVVDDGSTDETAVIVADFATRDPRIRLLCQKNQGACLARNAGLEMVQHEWVMFLDADDLLLPQHLQRITAVALSDSSLDAVHSGWARLTPDGNVYDEDYCQETGDLFALMACRCAFPPFTCIVRRRLAAAVGGFDPNVRSNQDWDFWQRVTRTGAQFGRVPEVLGYYRIRAGSISSSNPETFFADGLAVIAQGHTADERIAHLQPVHANGRNPADISQVRLMWVCWSAGLLLGRGEDPRVLLAQLSDDHWPSFDAYGLVHCLFRGVAIGRGETFDHWHGLWPELEVPVKQFLDAFEAQAQAPDLARLAQRHLEQLIMKHSQRKRPFAIGGTWAMAVQVEEPLPALEPPPGTAVCRVEVWLDAKYLGAVNVETPQQMARAISEEFAWTILGDYAERHLLPQLQLAVGTTGVSVWRDDVHLATLPPTKPEVLWEMAWNEVGWTLFMQEIWDRPSWPNSYFYDVALLEPGDRAELQVETAVTLNLADPWPDLLVRGKDVTATLAVAGEAVATCTLPATDGRIAVHALRANLTQAAGFDLCRAVVQYALLERPLADPTSLRQRLQEKCGGTGR
ncbi:MAG: glycosyltransferase family 2 protein [Ardenticatenaceae bacterium]|nr:glycosyltransferase family 2 protein [Ardenticatenaceae bacterium]